MVPYFQRPLMVLVGVIVTYLLHAELKLKTAPLPSLINVVILFHLFQMVVQRLNRNSY